MSFVLNYTVYMLGLVIGRKTSQINISFANQTLAQVIHIPIGGQTNDGLVQQAKTMSTWLRGGLVLLLEQCTPYSPSGGHKLYMCTRIMSHQNLEEPPQQRRQEAPIGGTTSWDGGLQLHSE